MTLAGPDYLILGFVFFFGSAIGSFLNVCIYRLPLDLSIAWPASYCPQCRTPIKSVDNFPILGYLRLGGKCRSCKIPISKRYPIVEAITGLAAIGSVLWQGYTVEAGVYFVLFAILLPATLIDFEYQIIPNELTYTGAGIGLVFSFFRSDFGWQESLTGIAVGAGSLLALRTLGTLMFKKEAMGLGDVKLMAVIGAFAGWKATILSVFLGSIVGTFYSIPILIQEARRHQKGTHVIPFGPFLALGGLLAAIFGETIWLLLWPV